MRLNGPYVIKEEEGEWVEVYGIHPSTGAEVHLCSVFPVMDADYRISDEEWQRALAIARDIAMQERSVKSLLEQRDRLERIIAEMQSSIEHFISRTERLAKENAEIRRDLTTMQCQDRMRKRLVAGKEIFTPTR